MEYAVFKNALKEANKTKKFKIINEEINMTHRAIRTLIENGFRMDSKEVICLEENLLVKMTQLRRRILEE